VSDTANAGDFYRAGKLSQAITAANAAVRAQPAVLAPRVLLAELLLFAGNIERADVVLDAAGDIDPDAAVVVAEFRQLLRAELARRQLRRDGRVPEFLGEPTPALQALLAARVALRAGDRAAAAAHAAQAEAVRPRVPGRHGQTAFADLRDACDLHAGLVEVLTTTGKYFWIPAERIESAVFHPPRRPRDLYWRRAKMAVLDGPDGEVYLPAIYATDDSQDEPTQLGRATDWLEQDGLVTGMGQRIWLVGDEALAMQALDALEFGPPDAAA
jgi:type VI secretion system protein ImpE